MSSSSERKLEKKEKRDKPADRHEKQQEKTLSYPVFLLNSLIEVVIDQMKDANTEFQQLIQMASHQKHSKDLFLDFVRNDPDFRQIVNREQFIASLLRNPQFKNYRLDADDFTRKNISLLLGQLFDLLETPRGTFPYVLFFQALQEQKKIFGIASDLDWQQYYKYCALECIKDEAQKKGIVHDNIQELREYEYKNLNKSSQEAQSNKKMTEERIFREHARNTAALILNSLKKQIRHIEFFISST